MPPAWMPSPKNPGSARPLNINTGTIKTRWALESLPDVWTGGRASRFDSETWRQDLVDALTYQPAPERTGNKNRVMPHVMAYAARTASSESNGAHS